MLSSLCFFKCPKTWISVLAPLPIVAGFLGYGFVSKLIATALIISTTFYTFSKRNQRLQEKSVKSEVLRPDCLPHSHRQEVVSKAQATETKSITHKKEEQEKEEERRRQLDDYLSRSSPTILSESDCLGRSSSSTEDSEVDWMFQDEVFRSPDDSDGSISDEESLFEIALPSGQYLGHLHRQQEPKFNLQKKMPDINVLGSCFKQHGLMEFLAELNEMNEEENLIEIDISMGSIKCPRFEIEA
ncbi:hypothetical protein Tsubulata_010096 [Turnera subulata]|uniref:Uncharacterized protein n=1 Tax=Turnera subulata TaxID=218843 RepID=A0A9Q0GDU3_9ROSI|nr:hypothetical protein Tsubulata_010096 [Turnera subulata]